MNISYQQEPYFDPRIVSGTYYINLERSPERKAAMESMAQEIGLDNLVRIAGIDGQGMEGDERRHALANTRVYEPNLLKRVTASDGPRAAERLKEKLALGKYACQASHLRAMKIALEQLKPEDEDKWIIVLEDDIKLFPEERARINTALSNAPENAGAIMLGGLQFLLDGQVPISIENDDLAIPMNACSTLGIAYRPEMLRLLVETYERNLAMTQKEGGISPVDDVNCKIQAELLGLSSDDDPNESQVLAHTFREASDQAEVRNHFYMLNPSSIMQRKMESTIGSNADFGELFYCGRKLVAFPKDIALSLRERITSIQHPSVRSMANRVVKTACVDGAMVPEDALALVTEMASTSSRWRTAPHLSAAKGR